MSFVRLCNPYDNGVATEQDISVKLSLFYSVFISILLRYSCTAPVVIGNWRHSKCC